MAKANESSVTTIDDAPKHVDIPAAVVLRGSDEGDNLSGERVELTIHPGEGENGRDPVFIGLNGTGYQIPRGIPVNVPAELVGILNDAKPLIYEAAGAAVRAREVQRFSYNSRAVA
jgi:hypothetical protein